jgi:competence protein ComEC
MEKRFYIFFIFILAALLLRLFFFYLAKPTYQQGQPVSFSATLFAEPKISNNYQTFWIYDKNGQNILVKTTAYPNYNYADKLTISGSLNKQVINNNTILVLNYPEISLENTNKSALLAVISVVRQKIIHTFENSLPGNLSSLMLGIVFGIKQDFSKSFLDSLKTVGVTHVIAASGMNVTLVGGFVFYFLSYFIKRQYAIIASVSLILFYALLAGFGASIIRASIMAIIAFSAEGFGKQKYSLYGLFLTGFIMLFIRPQFLQDIGFQLSFMSTLGILVIPKVISFGKNVLSQDLLTTTSSQIATFPILVSNFGIFSLWSVLVNTLVLWTVPFLMILGGISVIITFIYEPLARLILYLCLPFLLYFEKVVMFFSALKGIVTFDKFPWQFFVAYYFLLLSLMLFIFKKRNE